MAVAQAVNSCKKWRSSHLSLAVVQVTRTAQHPLYVKRVKKVKKFLAHDEANKCKLGDYVSFVPDRPRSARKRWQVADIIRQTAL